MRIDIEKASGTGPATIKLCHGNRSAVWDTSFYVRSTDHRSPMNLNQVFQELNAFWATLSQTEQAAYWDLYVEAKDALDNIFNLGDLTAKLQDVVRRIYDLPSLEKLTYWVVHRSGIRIPSDLKESFEDANGGSLNIYQREKTYLKSEYIELAILTVALRIMVPIWGEFIKNTRREVGGNSKELEAYRLLFFSRVHNSEAMRHLQQYVQMAVIALQGGEVNATAILNGMGIVEFADWMLAQAVVRRLSICPINASEAEGSHIVTNVYQFVKVGTRGGHKKHLKKFGSKVTLRKANEGDDSQKKTSAEVYKIKQDIPDGIRVLMQTYFDDPQRVLYRTLGLTKPGSMALVAPKPEGLDTRLRLCLEWVNGIPDFEVMPHHLTLTQWTLSPILSPDAIPFLTLDALKRALAITQTILWEWYFYDLAALVTAKPYEMDEDMMVGATETRGRIPKELLDDMNQRWPHIQQSKGKQSFRQTNVAAKAVDGLCDHMTISDWVLCCPNELVEKVSRNGFSRRFSIPGDIRWTLSNLLIKIESLIAQEDLSQV